MLKLVKKGDVFLYLYIVMAMVALCNIGYCIVQEDARDFYYLETNPRITLDFVDYNLDSITDPVNVSVYSSSDPLQEPYQLQAILFSDFRIASNPDLHYKLIVQSERYYPVVKYINHTGQWTIHYTFQLDLYDSNVSVILNQTIEGVMADLLISFNFSIPGGVLQSYYDPIEAKSYALLLGFEFNQTIHPMMVYVHSFDENMKFGITISNSTLSLYFDLITEETQFTLRISPGLSLKETYCILGDNIITFYEV